MTKLFSKISFKAISIILLFFFSSVGASVLVGPASALPNSTAALAPRPLTQLEANWAATNGNQFNQNYNPQTQINGSSAAYLGLSWLFPLPTHPAALISVSGGLGVDSAPMIINGTIYAVTQYGQVFALNAANGNVLWTDVLPILPNSTAGHGTGALSLHFHDGNVQFTTALFGRTPTIWIAAPDQKIYAINALNGKYELNFSAFTGINTVAGNNPGAVYTGAGSANVLLDQQRGIAITSVVSASSAATGRCMFRGWNVLVTPPKMIWESYCTPPQPGSGIPVDPNWEIKQIATMKGAWIFKGYGGSGEGADSPGGYGGPNGSVDLKALSATQLNATLYNDWGYVQSAACSAITGGGSTGGTAAGWGSPWLIDTKTGIAYVPTNNKDPYSSSCTPGPDLWSAAIMAINDTSGQWVWGHQVVTHDLWDWDCSWWQALGNETVNGVNTQVLWKTCKAGYLLELNAATGALIWSWTPPTSYLPRCHYCYMYDPLNATQMNWEFFNPSLKPTLMFPSLYGVFENEASYSPTLNYLFLVGQMVPSLVSYIPMNQTNYKTNGGLLYLAPGGGPAVGPGVTGSNATVYAVNAATGQMVWSHFIPLQGYRGGNSNSGNVVYLTLSSGDMLMLNAQTGSVIKDLYIGGPLNVLPSIGATSSGAMEIIFPITAGLVSWGTGVPGDIVALSLQNVPGGGGSIATTTATTTVATTVTASGASGGFDTTTAYGIAAVAVIFIIATGYFAMKSRKKTAP